MASFRRYDIESIDPSEVPDWISETYVGQLLQVATVTVLVYDSITTMDKEVKYFWKGPLRSVNVIYFANRYIGLFGAIGFLFWNSYGVNLAICNFAIWSQEIANWFTVLLIDYILMIRVLALYSRHALLSTCLQIILGLEAIIKLAMVIYICISGKNSVTALPPKGTTCSTDGIPSWHWTLLDWTIPLAYSAILLVLAIYKAVEFWRMSASFKGFTLVKVLIQDQIIYFVLVLLCSVVNIIQLRILGENVVLEILLQEIGNPTFLCIIGSRLLVNLKEAGDLNLIGGTNCKLASRTVSEMEFEERNVEVSDNERATGFSRT